MRLSWLCLLPSSALAGQSVSLVWDSNSETNLAGYVIYYGTASGQYSNSNNVGNVTNTTVSGLQEGRNYYFVVTAYDASGLESDPSNEASYQEPPLRVIFSPPPVPSVSNSVSKVKVIQNLTLGRKYLLESSHDLAQWTTNGPPFPAGSETVTNEFALDTPRRFFRLRQMP